MPLPDAEEVEGNLIWDEIEWGATAFRYHSPLPVTGKEPVDPERDRCPKPVVRNLVS